MRPSRLFARLATGAFRNISFNDFRRLVEAFGWELDRVNGSHHIFKHVEVERLINLQDHKGTAKPYQIRQFLRLVERYDLKNE